MDAIRVTKVERVQLDRFVPSSSTRDSSSSSSVSATSKQRISITLHLTPHHLVFSPTSGPDPSAPISERSRSILDPTQLTDEIWVPYPSITLLTRLPQTLKGLYPLQIRTRNFESYVLNFERDRDGGAEDVWQSVKDCAVSGRSRVTNRQMLDMLKVPASVEQLFAFNYSLPSTASSSKITLPPRAESSSSHQSPLSSSPAERSPTPTGTPSPKPTGWQVYNPRTEFTRQGVGSRTRGWRFTDINKDYSFSATYPSKLVVPSRIGDAVLQYAAKYRSKARIPALTYLHWANNVSRLALLKLSRLTD